MLSNFIASAVDTRGIPGVQKCEYALNASLPIGIRQKGKDNMPFLGEIQHAQDIGKNGKTCKYIWAACPECRKARWVHYVTTRPIGRCKNCKPKGSLSPLFKEGPRKTRQGYLRSWLPPNDFYRSMTDKVGYILEHRLIMAKYLGRCLTAFEVVHHKNGIKDDNRIENLELCTKNAHMKDHNLGYRDGYQKGLLDGRSKQIEELRQEIKLLQFQNRELFKRLNVEV